MTREKMNFEYLMWMYKLVYGNASSRAPTYCKLFSYLFEKDFAYTIATDENRAKDGIDLRYQFGEEKGIEEFIIADYAGTRVCSVLEMMIALSIRCEKHIMDSPDFGDRTSKWFWDMIDNISPKLRGMTDKKFNYSIVDDAIDRFLERKYKPNGEGGLFTVNRCKYDLRNIEIWYQMCWYLDTII